MTLIFFYLDWLEKKISKVCDISIPVTWCNVTVGSSSQSVVDCMTLHICPADNVIKSGTKLINQHMFLIRITIASYSSLQIYKSKFERFTTCNAGQLVASSEECFNWNLNINLISIYWSIMFKLTETIKMILFLS